MKKLNKKYIIIAVALLLCLSTGLTLAFVSKPSNILTNMFHVSTIESIIEEPDPVVKDGKIDKKPVVYNTGTGDALVRVRITVSPDSLWIAHGTDCKLNINIDENLWKYNNDDGYYYYQGILKPDTNSEHDDPSKGAVVFTEVTGATNEDGTWKLDDVDNFNIGIYQETIAATATSDEGTPIHAEVDGQYNDDNAMKIWEIYDPLSNQNGN